MNEIEVFLPTGPTDKKDVICVPNIEGRSAKTRWALLRAITRAGNLFRRSLKREEKDLLDSLGKEDPQVRQEHHCEARKELSHILDEHKESLQEKEVAYLRKLIASPSVSSELVERAKKSLHIDTACSNNHIETKERPYLDQHQNDASFRKEVWAISSQRTLEEHLSTEDNQNDEHTNDHMPEAKGMFSFIGRILGNGSNDDVTREEKVEDSDFMDDAPLNITVLGTSADDPACFPHVLTPPIMEEIRKNLPYAVANDNFWLKYSMRKHGSSLRAMINQTRNSSRSIVAIETMDGSVFGAFVSSPWIPRGQKYFGTGEAFLWRMEKSRFTPCDTPDEQYELESQIEVFNWTGENYNIQRLAQADAQLIIGGGGPDEGPAPDDSECGSGLVISPNLEDGFSNPCLTFKSPILPVSEGDTFQIANIEVWTMTPVDDVDQAENVELGRRFIFDHSNFVED